MRNLKILAVVGAVLGLGFLSFGAACADGGVFPIDHFSAYETGQRAFIYFTGQEETLVVSASFKGNAEDFSWVVPVPAKPTLDKANPNLFTDLAQITQDKNTKSTSNFGLTSGSRAPSSSVEIIEQKKVDVFDTTVLKATDENALAKWLNDHGYTFPSDQSSQLKSYVESGWYFVIAKIQPNLAQDAKTDFSLEQGMLTPLKLTFKSDKIIYPMKLTGIALRFVQPGATSTVTVGGSATAVPGEIPETVSLSMPIDLYILSTNKTQNESLTTSYANLLESSDLEKINNGLIANKITSGSKLFLTKMRAVIPAQQIAGDFTITDAPDNSVLPVPVDQTTNFYLTNLLFLVLTPIFIVFFPIPLGLFFILFILAQIHLKKRWLYILGLIYQTLACLILLSIALLVVAQNIADLPGLFLADGFIGATISFVALLVLGIYATVKMLKRSKKPAG